MPIPAEVTRISLKNILFPTDFSESSRTALPFARAIAQAYGATILLAHAIPPEPHRAVVFDRVPPYDQVVWQDARQKLTEFGHDEAFAGLQCKILLDQGDLSNVIPEMIRDNQVDLVVLGTHGRHGLSKLVLGSGAEQIYRSASCPVLTVGQKIPLPQIGSCAVFCASLIHWRIPNRVCVTRSHWPKRIRRKSPFSK